MSHIAELVNQATDLRREIKEKQSLLKSILEKLGALAKAIPPEPLADETREGTRKLLFGYGNQKLTLRTTADLLLAEFPAGGVIHAELVRATGDHFGTLFANKNVWRRREKDGHAFRKAVDALLTPPQSRAALAALASLDKDGQPKTKSQWFFGDSEEGEE